jgi:hypothetical protein
LTGTYASVLVICVAAIAIGRGIFACVGESSWNWLSPAVGFAFLLAVCEIAIRLPGHGWTAVFVVTALLGASLWIARRARVRPALVDGTIVVLGVLVATAIPFLATGRIGLLGVSVLNDTAFHLMLAAGLQHPELKSFTSYGPGYPVGPHAIVATMAQALGVSLFTAMTGLLVAIPVLTGLTALAGLQDVRRLPRWLVAILAAILYLSASWYVQGAFKEPIVGMLLLALVLVVRRGRGEGFSRPWQVAVPAGVLFVGFVYDFSYAGLAWPVLFIAIWCALELALRLMRPEPGRLLRDVRARAMPIIAGCGIIVLGTGADWERLRTFAESQGGAGLGTLATITKTDLGNIVGPLSAREALGIWLNYDYRFWPSDLHQARLLSLFALGIVLWGIVRELVDRDTAIPAALAGCAAIFLYSRHTQSPYVTAKALVIPAPLVALAAGRGLFRPVRLPGWRRRATAALILVSVPYLFLCFGSSFLALRDAQVDPSAHMRELHSLVRVLQDRPTLFLVHDDYYQYELLPVPATNPAVSPLLRSPILPAGFSAQKPWTYGYALDFDSVDAATLDRFDYVITARTLYQSEPPPNFHLVANTRSYDVWRRTGTTTARSVLPESGGPGADLDCTTSSGRRIAHMSGIARVRPRPIVQSLGWAIEPGKSASTTTTLSPGTWELSLAYTSATPIRVAAGAVRATLPANLDRPGTMWRIGQVRGDGRAMNVTLAEERPSPLSGPREAAYVTALAAVRAAPARTIPLSRACGRYIDWYRAVG